jgi:ATP-binding cassette subfamily F protein 3
MLAKMQPIAALADDPSLSFDFPNPTELRPPLITLDLASVGYTEGTPILSKLNLRIDPDDRIALLGRNGNGKTTLARLLAAQLAPMAGEMHASGKMKVGYFTQYQVEELHGDDTPLQHMSREMKGMTPGAVRAQLGRFGFSGDKAMTRVDKLSGGERARLALALITRDAPHLLILDEPTNHLDVDSREALVQALNGYDGAVILVSHDRHMVELTADRLVLVDDGKAVDYAGSIDDYIDFVLGRNQPKAAAKPKVDRKAAAKARDAAAALKKKPPRPRPRARGWRRNARRSTRRCSIRRAPRPSLPLPMSELASRRAKVAADLAAAEARWVEAAEQLEQAAA